MATLLLKNVPDELRDLLKARAERNRRSMNQEALVILEQAMPGMRRGLDVKAILALKPIEGGPVDWTKAVRQSRDEQDARDRRLALGAYGEMPLATAPTAHDGPVKVRQKKKR